jgi:oxygen-dependent protoporphyrinogen oxidase
MTIRVAVVGAGAAGLSAGLALKDAGIDFAVFDGADRAGGKVATLREDGWLVERAAIGLLDREGDLAPLANRLGLSVLPAGPDARRRWVVRDDELHALPSGPLSFAATGLLSASEKLGLLREPWNKARSTGDESVRAFFERRFGPAGPFLAEAIQTGIYAGSADRLDAAACFPALVEAERRAGSVVRGFLKRPPGPRRPRARLSSFADGLGELMSRLAAQLGPALRLSTPVTALRREADGWALRAGGAELRARAVLLACPAPQAAALLAPLDAALADDLAALAAAPLTTVHLGVRRQDVLGDVRGFGLLAPGRPVAGTLIPSSLWPGRAPEGHVLLTSLVGGARNPAAAALPDEVLEAMVREELGRTVRLRAGAAAAFRRVIRWPQAVPQYQPGHLGRVARLEGRLGAHAGLGLTGAWYRGVGVLDCLRDGRRQAERLSATS